jgi:hypothetical protein
LGSACKPSRGPTSVSSTFVGLVISNTLHLLYESFLPCALSGCKEGLCTVQ